MTHDLLYFLGWLKQDKLRGLKNFQQCDWFIDIIREECAQVRYNILQKFNVSV